MNTTPSRVGRPPGPHDDTLAKILPTALDLFLAEGGAALTPTRLNAETGVSRATIYRNWPEPADLVGVMLRRATELPPEWHFSGDLEVDLHRAMELLRNRLEHRPARAFFAACIEYSRTAPRIATAAEEFIAGILQPLHVVLGAAVEAGQVDGSTDELVAEVAGPVVLEYVIMGRGMTKRRAASVVDHFLDHHLIADGR